MDERNNLSNIRQVCIVVKDFEKTLRRYMEVFGISFETIEFDAGKTPGVLYKGKPADYKIKVAKALIGGWEFEIITPVRGESAYTEFLREKGEGLHHVGIFVEDINSAEKSLQDHGFRDLMSGPIVSDKRNGKFQYYEHDEGLGLVLELLDDPDAHPSLR